MLSLRKVQSRQCLREMTREDSRRFRRRMEAARGCRQDQRKIVLEYLRKKGVRAA